MTPIELEISRWIILFISAFISSILASIAGIGGGGVLIPLYSLIAGIDVKTAIVLSIITIAGNSFIRGIYYFFKKNDKTKNRFLSNFDLIKLIILFDGNTAFLGFLLNTVTPNFVIAGIIIIVLIIMIVKTLQKVIEFIQNKDEETTSFIIIDNIDVEIKDVINNGKKGDNLIMLLNNALLIILILALIVFFTIIRSTYDNYMQYIIYAVQFVVLSLLGYYLSCNIVTNYQFKKHDEYNFIEGDIKWTNYWNFAKYIISASLVGFISTLLGLGGGMIINPIMLTLNVPPQVVVATSSITTFFSSTISASQFIIVDGNLYWYYGVLFCTGALASLIGIFILKLIKKNTIKIVITIILTIELVASLVLLTIINIIKIFEEGWL